ncbi:MAG: TonB-dependent receptor [Flavobacteriia bacterium]|nr:TonB-dependent receptor [Flavobacteriia bacterium]
MEVYIPQFFLMKVAPIFFIAIAAINVSFSQDQSLDSISRATQFLEEVVVSDSRFSLKRSQSGKAVIKINAEEIQRFSGLGLGVLLSSHLGIDVIGKNMYSGQNPTISIRGGRNRQVLILIDGVRVSDPSRIDNDFDINALNIEMVESIEIIKGAASSLYGSSAATGVIHITTKKAKESPQLILNKSWGTELASDQPIAGVTAGNHLIQLSSTVKGVGVNLAYAERYSDGMSAVVGQEPDPFGKVNFNVGISGNLASKIKWRLNWNQDNVEAEYDNGFPLGDADFSYTTLLDRWSLHSQYLYTGGSLSVNAGYQKNKRSFESDYPISFESENLNVDLFNKYIFNAKFYTILGLQYQESSMTAAYHPQTRQTDVYWNSVYLDPTGLNVNIGIRYNRHNAYGGHWIYNLNPSYSFDLSSKKKMKIMSSYGKAFIAPGLYQLYDPFFGNTALIPENNLSFELGTEIWSEKGRFSAVFFHRKEDPTLIFDFSRGEMGQFGNSESVIVYRGLEWSYDFKLFDEIQTRLNYIFTETKGGDLRSVPKHAVTGVMDLPLTRQTHLNLLGQYADKRVATDGMPLEAYSLFTLQLNHKFQNPETQLYFGIYNLFDTEYVIIPQYATRGRNFLVGLSIQL